MYRFLGIKGIPFWVRLLKENGQEYLRHVLKIKKSSYDYLCPILTLFGIFILKTLNRSSLRFGGFADKSVQKQPKI